MPVKSKNTRKMKVVIGEDERHLRLLFKVMMEALNTEVVAMATNGREALEYYRKVRPHIMLLDINMPGMTGDEVLEEIIAEFPNAFIIMLTSVSDLETVQKCLNSGASNYLRKDTPISEMKEIIKSTWKTRLEKKRLKKQPQVLKTPASSNEKPRRVRIAPPGTKPATAHKNNGTMASRVAPPIQRPNNKRPGKPGPPSPKNIGLVKSNGTPSNKQVERPTTRVKKNNPVTMKRVGSAQKTLKKPAED